MTTPTPTLPPAGPVRHCFLIAARLLNITLALAILAPLWGPLTLATSLIGIAGLGFMVAAAILAKGQ